jgi:hypothetical protein
MTEADDENAIVSYIVENWLGPAAQTNLWCSAIVIISLDFLGIPWWKAAVVGALTLGCMIMNFGRKTFSRVGFLLLLLALMVWLEWLPPIERWRAAIGTLLSRLI